MMNGHVFFSIIYHFATYFGPERTLLSRVASDESNSIISFYQKQQWDDRRELKRQSIRPNHKKEGSRKKQAAWRNVRRASRVDCRATSGPLVDAIQSPLHLTEQWHTNTLTALLFCKSATHVIFLCMNTVKYQDAGHCDVISHSNLSQKSKRLMVTERSRNTHTLHTYCIYHLLRYLQKYFEA